MKKYSLRLLLIFPLISVPVVLHWMNWPSPSEVKWLISYARLPSPKEFPPQLSKLPPCPGCNLILISMDTLRADRLGFMGSENNNSPNLDRIASKSIIFKSAYTNAFFTTPSHMTAFTGLYPFTHRVESSDMFAHALDYIDKNGIKITGPNVALPSKYTTLAEVLSQNGYNTHWFATKNSRYLKLDDGFGRGFKNIGKPPFTRGFRVLKSDQKIFNTNSLSSLKNTEKIPQFLFLHTWINHAPYFWRTAEGQKIITKLPISTKLLDRFALRARKMSRKLLNWQLATPLRSEAKINAMTDACLQFDNMEPCFSKYIEEDPFWHGVGLYQLRQLKKIASKLSGDQIQIEKNNLLKVYDESVADIDSQIGQMWTALEKMGALENTLIVFFSDHGEELLDHGQFSHWNFYEHTAKIPFLIYHPKVDGNIVSHQPISLVDLMPTVLSILDIDTPAQVQGHSISSHPLDFVYGGTLKSEFIIKNGWKYMNDSFGNEKLFYLTLDPDEKNNLINYNNRWIKNTYYNLIDEKDSLLTKQLLDK